MPNYLLDAGSIIPWACISSSSFLTDSRYAGGSRYGGRRVGALSPESILCTVMLVHTGVLVRDGLWRFSKSVRSLLWLAVSWDPTVGSPSSPPSHVYASISSSPSAASLLLHHHLRVSAGIRADIDWNGTAFFLNNEWLPSPQFQLYTDTSQLGYSCYWQGHWLCGSWDRKQLSHDIQWKELFAVLLAATAWGA